MIVADLIAFSSRQLLLVGAAASLPGGNGSMPAVGNQLVVVTRAGMAGNAVRARRPYARPREKLTGNAPVATDEGTSTDHGGSCLTDHSCRGCVPYLHRANRSLLRSNSTGLAAGRGRPVRTLTGFLVRAGECSAIAISVVAWPGPTRCGTCCVATPPSQPTPRTRPARSAARPPNSSPLTSTNAYPDAEINPVA